MSQDDKCKHGHWHLACGACAGFDESATVGRESYSGVVQAIEAAKWIPRITDSDLRAECERRNIAIVSPTLLATIAADAREVGYKRFEHERDEWKRRAETAEAKADVMEQRAVQAETRVSSLESRINDAYVPKIVSLMRLNEMGEGIAGQLPDNSVAWLDEDLLADDA